MRKDVARDGWGLTVAMLGHGGVPDGWRPGPRRPVAEGATAPAFRLAPTVQVLDRPTPRTAAISWSDPGVCHYGYQIWDLTPARLPGRCVLSGRAIAIGDSVYVPRGDDPPPLNSDAMIAFTSVGG